MGLSQTKTQKEKDKTWVFVLLLLIGLGFIFFSQSEDNKASNHGMPDPERMKQVDAHLKDTAFNIEADKRQRQIEAYQQLNKLKDSSAQSPYRESKDFSLESDPYMQSLTQELDRSQGPSPWQTPEQIIQERLYENQQLQKASEAYREAYAEQFIENARKGGWQVELGPNFEVLSVKKIQTRRNPSLFDDGSSAGGR